MYVHRSNRTEQLLDALCELVGTPVADASGDPLLSVFEPECIVVQGPGMERWLGLELSRRLGIWGNPSFPFPRTLLERAMQSLLGPVEDPGISFEPETLMWSVAAALPELLGDPRFAPLQGYLRDGSDEKLMQLSERIARVFDRYVIYRPDLVTAWEQGREFTPPGLDPTDLGWQSELWRKLVERHGAVHLAARMDVLLRALAGREQPLDDFPRRISLFGISTLPPLYLRGLAALSHFSEVHLFVLSPSREYWADIRSRREQLRSSNAEADTLFDPEALHFDEGNPLLASLGRLGREFQMLVEDAVDYREDERDLYSAPEGAQAATMLGSLQADILALQRRGPGAGDEPPCVALPGDRSIAVHACHGPMREAEVLRDQLLALFDADPTLEPRDVVVMTPDIETYAPYLEAAFGGGRAPGEGGAGRVRIPCRISDRSVRATHQVVESFSRLVELLGSRMRASDVLDVLARDPIRRRFGFDVEDDPTLQRWVVGSGIRWGIDAQHRAAEGQPAADENTWRFGLDRLLLGRAVSAEGAIPFGRRTPYDDIEGEEGELLGRLAEFCETLFSYRARSEKPLSWPDWRQLFEELIGAMLLCDNDSVHELQSVRDALQLVSERAVGAGFRRALSLSVVREQLEDAFEASRPSSGFLSGGVTFCEMVPMRSIPFRVVCLIGMGDEAFPRIRRPQSFDLIAQRRRVGDRSSRDDDRYLFLEALLSARDHLLITYPGQDVRTNAELPPSVVVGELLDQLGTSFLPDASSEPTPESAAALRDRLVLRHPLQPFSPRYFGADPDPRLFSYAQPYCDGARVLLEEREQPPVFLSEPIASSTEPEETLEIGELVEWVRHPTRYFLRKQLALRLLEDEDEVDDREPMDLSGLPQWQLGDALLERALERGLGDDALDLARATGELPLGVPGACAFEEVAREVSQLAIPARALRDTGPLPSLSVDHALDGITLNGTLDGLFRCGQLRHHYTRLEGRSELELWVRHLLLNWIAPEGHPRESHLVGRPVNKGLAHVCFTPVDDPEEALIDLLRLFRLGRSAALPLFPRTSRKYASQRTRTPRKNTDPEEQAILNAYEEYRGSSYRSGESEDPYLRQVFGNLDPLARSFSPTGDPDARDGFRALARQIFDPLLAHREEVS